MIKYVPLDAILNYIPLSIQEETTPLQLKSWAYQLFKQSNLNWKYNIVGEVIELKNHKAKLPSDLVGIYYIGYAATDLDIPSIIGIKNTNLLDNTDRRLIVAQQQLMEDTIFNYFKPIKYIGSDSSFHHLSYPNCTIGFSVDKKLSCITVDLMEGSIFILYKTIAKEDDEIIIPDDPSLMQALSFYAQAQFYLDKTGRGDRNAFTLYNQMLSMATTMFIKAKSTEMFRNYSVDAHESLIKDRFKHLQLPTISGKNRNIWL